MTWSSIERRREDNDVGILRSRKEVSVIWSAWIRTICGWRWSCGYETMNVREWVMGGMKRECYICASEP